jgi:hypothetical protein
MRSVARGGGRVGAQSETLKLNDGLRRHVLQQRVSVGIRASV